MRHKQKTQNLSRFSSYFKATLHSLARNVIIHQSIVTTKIRAKLARRLVERLVTWGKEADSLAARRMAFAVLGCHDLTKKLFTEIGPMFAGKSGGYTRIIPYKRRRGDNAELVILELSVQKALPKSPKVKPTDKTEKAIVKAAKAAPKPEKPEPKHEHKEHKEKETKKPAKKSSGGLRKFFKSERDSL